MTSWRDFQRVLIHIPVGLLNVALVACAAQCGDPVAGSGMIALAVLFGLTFLVYEVTQGGKPHKDVKGYAWGLGIGGVAWLIAIIVSGS